MHALYFLLSPSGRHSDVFEWIWRQHGCCTLHGQHLVSQGGMLPWAENPFGSTLFHRRKTKVLCPAGWQCPSPASIIQELYPALIFRDPSDKGRMQLLCSAIKDLVRTWANLELICSCETDVENNARVDFLSQKFCGFFVSPVFFLLMVKKRWGTGNKPVSLLIRAFENARMQRSSGSSLPLGGGSRFWRHLDKVGLLHIPLMCVQVWVIPCIYYPVCSRFSEQNAEENLQNIVHSLLLHAQSAVMSLCVGFPARFASSWHWRSGFTPHRPIVEEESWSLSCPFELLSFQMPLVYTCLSWSSKSVLHITLGVLLADMKSVVNVAILLSLFALPAFFLWSVAVDCKGARNEWSSHGLWHLSRPVIKHWEVKFYVLHSFPLWRHEKNYRSLTYSVVRQLWWVLY